MLFRLPVVMMVVNSLKLTINPKFRETLLTLDIVKVLKGKDTPIQGVVFLHTDSKGNQEEVTTDEKGKAVLKGLTRGIHTNSGKKCTGWVYQKSRGLEVFGGRK